MFTVLYTSFHRTGKLYTEILKKNFVFQDKIAAKLMAKLLFIGLFEAFSLEKLNKT